MTTARTLAVLLIAIEAAALSLRTNMVIPALLTVAAGGSLFLRWRVRISRRVGFWLALLGGLLLQVVLTVVRNSVSGDAASQQFQVVQDTGCYLLAIQAVMLWVKRPDDRPTVVLAGVGILVMLCAGMQAMETWRESLFRTLVIAFVAMIVTMFLALRTPHFQPARPSRMWWWRSIVFVLLVTVAFASWATAESIDDWLDSFWSAVILGHGEYQTGFSGSGDLAAVSTLRVEQSDQVQLQVQSITRPGYLRGQVFSDFNGFEWDADLDYETLYPLSQWPTTLQVSRKSGNLFGRTAATVINWQVFRCEPVYADGWVFAPLGTSHIVAPANFAEINEYDVFMTTELSEDASYVALLPLDDVVASLDPVQRKVLTRVPRAFKDELNRLAAESLAGCTTAGEKIAAVEHYFRSNHQYQLDHDWDLGEQNLEMLYFLANGPPAHCEFFATGAALLLRSAGVPCRYVTGYVVVEPSKKAGNWLARGRHAHAWVEAYDDDRGWVVVEATPDAGVPGTSEHAKLDGAGSSGSWTQWITGIPWTLPLACCVVLAVGLGLILIIRKKQRRRGSRECMFEVQQDPLYSALHGLLSNMDRYVRNFELERGNSETLHDFAWRIRQRAFDEPHLQRVAEWYPIYAACRYDGDVDEVTVENLAQRLHAAQNR